MPNDCAAQFFGTSKPELSGKYVNEKNEKESVDFIGKNEVIVTGEPWDTGALFSGTYQIINGNDLIVKATMLGTDLVLRGTLSDDKKSFLSTDGRKYISVVAREAAQKAEEVRRREAERKAVEASKSIVAISDSRMNWNDAKTWCEQKGGRLPLINGAAALSGDQFMQIIKSGTMIIDGVGIIKTGENRVDWTTPWPAHLPSDYYWTGTVDSDYSDGMWGVGADDGKVGVGSSYQSSEDRVVCVR